MKDTSMMIEIGNWNNLKSLKKTEFGVFFDGGDDGEILLPKRYVPQDFNIGDSLDVFICFDSEDRMVATTQAPKVKVNEFGLLKVVSTTNHGAFLDWGLPKDLFLPFAEQTKPPRVGENVVVFVYTDKSDRLSASMRLERYISKEDINYTEGQAVKIRPYSKTDLGYKSIVEGRHLGMLFDNEVFQDLIYGEEISAFIKKVRPDGKLDLGLQIKTGHKAADDIGPRILELLEKGNGFLEVNDKTSAEKIYDLFGVSKKKYKIALGGLYKKRLITIEEDGIRLVKK